MVKRLSVLLFRVLLSLFNGFHQEIEAISVYGGLEKEDAVRRASSCFFVSSSDAADEHAQLSLPKSYLPIVSLYNAYLKYYLEHKDI